jgi:hypothetical protein
VVGLVAGDGREDEEVDGDAQQREACHQEPGDRPRLERDVEARGEGLGRGLRRADVGADRNIHADEARRGREQGAEQEADRHGEAEEDRHQHEEHRADDADGGVLPPEIGGGALLDGLGDLLHAGGARVERQDLAGGDHAVGDRGRPQQDHQQQR